MSRATVLSERRLVYAQHGHLASCFAQKRSVTKRSSTISVMAEVACRSPGGLLTWPWNWHLRLAPPRLPLSELVLSACRPHAYSNRRVIK